MLEHSPTMGQEQLDDCPTYSSPCTHQWVHPQWPLVWRRLLPILRRPICSCGMLEGLLQQRTPRCHQWVMEKLPFHKKHWQDFSFYHQAIFRSLPYSKAPSQLTTQNADHEPLLYCGFCNLYDKYHEHDCDYNPLWDPYDGYPSDVTDWDNPNSTRTASELQNSSRMTFVVRLLFTNNTHISKVPDRTLCIHSTRILCMNSISEK